MAEEDKSGGASFAELFEQQEPVRRRRLSVGDRVQGTVVQVGKQDLFVDLGDGLQGSFGRELFEAGDLPATGATLEGFVLALESDSHARLGRALGAEGIDVDQMAEALETQVPVEGKVTGVNKGGVVVSVGGVRGFCPISQLDAGFVQDSESFVGQTLRFVVTEMKGDQAVLSRRRLLERDAQAQRAQLLSELEVGAVRKGPVTSVRPFGAFVDLGGMDGLIPNRELGHERTTADAALSPGDVVEVQVVQLDSRNPDDVRITLSMRALQTDPWEAVDSVAPAGRVVQGSVTRLTEFGAFVRLSPGLEGLLHVSELPPQGEQSLAQLQTGQPVTVQVRGVDHERRRISLCLPPPGAQVGADAVRPKPRVGAIVRAEVVQIERYGVFVQIEGTTGREGRGLIPRAELGASPGTDLRKAYPVGTWLTAKILETGERRLRLSVQAAEQEAEKAVFDQFRDSQAGQSLGSFGDLLKKSLKKE